MFDDQAEPHQWGSYYSESFFMLEANHEFMQTRRNWKYKSKNITYVGLEPTV